jgi:hypothetical protein
MSIDRRFTVVNLMTNTIRFGMELRRALTIFRLRGRVSIEELNSTFRELVKKYHPDKVRDYPDWAHERMSEINDAYETLAQWISKPKKEEQSPPVSDEEERDYQKESGASNPATRIRDIPPLSPDQEKLFSPVFNRFINGYGLYYQYGLEKPTYRNEGVRRFRFREAVRTIRKAGEDMDDLSRVSPHPAIVAVSRFIRLTVAEMNLGEPTFPNYHSYRKFDDRLRNARRAFDEALKEYFFPELVPSHLRGRATAGLYACYTAFILYISVFHDGDRRKLGILMAARYESFMELAEYRSERILPF